MFTLDSKDMKKIIRTFTAIAAIAATFLFAGCDQYEPTKPYEPVQMTPTMTLAQFKSLYRGAPLQIMDKDIVISGKVVSTDINGNVYRSLYIQDESAGLEVKIGKTGLYNDYKLGQTIYIKPQYLALGAYGGSVQLGAVSSEEKYETSYIDAQALINRTIFRGEIGEPLAPIEIVNKYDINDAKVCMFVKLNNVVYTEGYSGFGSSKKPLSTWAVKQNNDPDNKVEADTGNQVFKLGGKEVVVRTSGYARFAGEEVGMQAGDRCNISGILTKYRTTYQLVLLSSEDVERL